MDQNLENAFNWYRKSAEQGFVWGCYQLGSMYESGTACEQNMEKAIFWLEKANAQSHPDAGVSLEKLHELKLMIEKQSLIPWPSYGQK